MKEPKFTFDKAEFIVLDESNSRRMLLHLNKDRIANIVFEKCTETGFLKEIPSEKITLNLRIREEPLVYYRKKNADEWENYKAGLRQFCKENRVTLYDYTVEEQ